jgi:hypothetical protein
VVTRRKRSHSERALSFYRDGLGLIARSTATADRIDLSTADEKDSRAIVLVRDDAREPFATNEARPSLTFRVSSLPRAIERYARVGARPLEAQPCKEGVGHTVTVTDPFGTQVSIMESFAKPDKPIAEPRLYNYGLYVPDMRIARECWEQSMRFTALTERFLPIDLPRGHADKSFGFMLHRRRGIVPAQGRVTRPAPLTLTFTTASSQSLKAVLDKAAVTYWTMGGTLYFSSLSGIRIAVDERRTQ